MLRGGEAHLLHGVGGGFERVDLGGGELVAGGLVPVGAGRHGLGRMVGEADRLDLGLPIGAGRDVDALHYSEAPPPLAWVLPKPPRTVEEDA